MTKPRTTYADFKAAQKLADQLGRKADKLGRSNDPAKARDFVIAAKEWSKANNKAIKLWQAYCYEKSNTLY